MGQVLLAGPPYVRKTSILALTRSLSKSLFMCKLKKIIESLWVYSNWSAASNTGFPKKHGQVFQTVTHFELKTNFCLNWILILLYDCVRSFLFADVSRQHACWPAVSRTSFHDLFLLKAPHDLQLIANYVLALVMLTPTVKVNGIKVHSITHPMARALQRPLIFFGFRSQPNSGKHPSSSTSALQSAVLCCDITSRIINTWQPAVTTSC